jgi:hypothetical protein
VAAILRSVGTRDDRFGHLELLGNPAPEQAVICSTLQSTLIFTLSVSRMPTETKYKKSTTTDRQQCDLYAQGDASEANRTITNPIRSRVSSGSIVSDYGLDDRAIGVRSPAGTKDFFPLASVSRPALGPTQPPVQSGPGVLSPGVKARPGRDADHSPPSSTEVENE